MACRGLLAGVLGLCCLASAMQPACASAAVACPGAMQHFSFAMPPPNLKAGELLGPGEEDAAWVNLDDEAIFVQECKASGWTDERIKEGWAKYSKEAAEAEEGEEVSSEEEDDDDEPDAFSEMIKLRGRPLQKAESRPQFAAKLAGEFEKQAKIADMRPDRVLRRWGWRIRCKYAEVQDGMLDYLGLLVEKIMPMAIVAMHFPPLSKFTREWGDKPGTVKDDDDEPEERGQEAQAPQQGQVLQ